MLHLQLQQTLIFVEQQTIEQFADIHVVQSKYQQVRQQVCLQAVLSIS
jgi:hypothetical protein